MVPKKAKQIDSSSSNIHGKINIQVLSGRDLKPTVQYGYGEILRDAVYKHCIKTGGYSNPYCQIEYDGITQSTHVAYKSTDPQWNSGPLQFELKISKDPITERSNGKRPMQPEENEGNKTEITVGSTELLISVHHEADVGNAADEPAKPRASSHTPTQATPSPSSAHKTVSPPPVAHTSPSRIVNGVSYVVSLGSAVLGSKRVEEKVEAGKVQKEGFQEGQFCNVLLGKARIDLTELLTGQSHHMYGWYQLLDESGESSGEVKLSINLTLENNNIETGDYVKLVVIGDRDLYFPLPLNAILEVEDAGKDFDQLLVAYYTPEGWKCVAEVNQNVLTIVAKRQKSRIERYESFLFETAEAVAESEMFQSSLARARDFYSTGKSYVSSYYCGNEVDAAAARHSDNDEKKSALSSPSGARSMPAFTLECPITAMPITDPVVAADGHTYEREAIERWLTDHNTSPVTGQVLPTKALFKNYGLMNSIEQFQQTKQLQDQASEGYLEEKESLEEKK